MSRPLLLPRLLPLVLALLTAGLVQVQAQQQTPPPRAVPLEEDGQKPVPKAIPVGPDAAPVTAVPVDPPRPKGPDEDLFDYGTMLYDRKEFALAVKSFGEYLQSYPQGQHVPVVMFRIGECYFQQRQLKVAETYYSEVVNRYPSSDSAASAAYRLGFLKFNARKYEEAARDFALCETKSSLPQVRLAASFNKANAFQMLGDPVRQKSALATVIAVKTDNPYRVDAMLTLGTLLLGEDKKPEALALFLDVLRESKENPKISEAAVKAAVLHVETGKPAEAVTLFEKALSMPETTEANRAISLFGVVQALFAKGDYDGVIDSYNRNSTALPDGDIRPKMLLMVGNAHRAKKSYARAVEVYQLIESGNPGTDQAFEAGYWRLYCFYLLNDRMLGQYATEFIQKNAPARPAHEYLNLARLIRADFFFNRQDYAQAATSFGEVQVERLAEKLQPGAWFNKGWALAEAQRPQEAIVALTQFLNSFPNHELTAKALARRGLAYAAASDASRAARDFEKVIKDHPNSEAAEMAYLQSGLIAMKRDDAAGTINAFEKLVQKFPASPAAAQAWYGIGRGYFRLSKFDSAIPPLRKAIERDGKNYLDQASQMIIQMQHMQGNVEELARTVDAYRSANPNASIPMVALSWLGKNFYDQKLYARATKYLSLASTPDVPANTDPDVWFLLGSAFLETKDYAASIKASDNYLATTRDGGLKARAMVNKGRALLGLGKFDDARKVVQEGLNVYKEGRLQAFLLILEGDIFVTEGDKLAAEGKDGPAKEKYAAAAGKYMVPAQFLEDPEVTPEALDKVARVLDKSGQSAKAEDMRKALQTKFPKYQPR